MFSHSTYLRLGSFSSEGGDPLSLAKEGYELSGCNYSFLKGVDDKGQVKSRTAGGVVEIEIHSLPTKELIEWSLNPRRYLDGMIVFCDDKGIPLEKVMLNRTACISMEISYIKTGNGYISTSLVLSAKKMIVGQSTLENNWVNV